MLTNRFARLFLSATLLVFLALYGSTERAEAQYLAANEKQTVAEKISTKSPNEAITIQGVNTAGTVRVNMLANLEALLNISANSAEILGITWGSALVVGAIWLAPGQRKERILFALLPLTLGITAPSALNMIIATARDANLFS